MCFKTAANKGVSGVFSANVQLSGEISAIYPLKGMKNVARWERYLAELYLSKLAFEKYFAP
jgi:hypothetical protein